jgi:phosphatidylinositol alpha 1,6-mannosyltransferase
VRGIKLVLVGDGPARGALEKALPGAVFVGERHGTQLARLYASLDIFVHTGPLETFGQAIQEALASGVPVVAPAAGGPLDLVKPGQTGYLVPPGDGRSITRAVSELAADPVLRRHVGRQARASVAGRTWAAVGDELLDHYRAAMGFPATVPAAISAGRSVPQSVHTPDEKRQMSVP